MKRILIIGSGGAGKSTFSLKLQKALQLPLIHLDRHYWKVGWVESSKEEWALKVKDLVKGESWIMDGNYSGTLHIRVPEADTVIFLDFPNWKCVYRVLKRVVQGLWRTRPDMAEGCRERFDWEFVRYVWNYPKRSRPKVMRMLKEEGDRLKVYIVKNDAELEDFLKEI